MSISPTTGPQFRSVLETGQVGNVPLQVQRAEFDRFQQALEKAGFPTKIGQVEAPVRIAQLDPLGTATDATTPADAANAANRAVMGLELDGEADDTAGTGTAILEGLGKLRGVFDSQLDGVAQRSTVTNPYDSIGMMQLQAELFEFSLVVDVTSKLAGKSTQALDSLMKGQ
jgi:type III secretion system YscI/HrpB-like protein